MTEDHLNGSKGGSGKIIGSALGAIMFFTMLFCAFFLSSEISSYAYGALYTCATVIIPSVFPFALISDAIVSALTFRMDKHSGTANAMIAVALGIVCGFPIAASVGSRLYDNGTVSRDTLEKCIAFGSIPSLPFCTAVIGGRMLSEERYGIYLWIILACCSFIMLFITGGVSKENHYYDVNSRQNYTFVSSVSKCAMNAINVCAFVTAFSIPCGFICKYVDNVLLRATLVSLLEVTSACGAISSSAMPPKIRFAAIAFTCALSGASVLCQVFTVCGKYGIKKRRYCALKIIYALCVLLVCACAVPFIY